MRRGQQQQLRGVVEVNSVTFTLSPGNDAQASGIRFEGMWVGEINTYTQRQKYRGRWILFLRLWESVPMQICGVILMGCDVLCHVSVMMMADVCVCMFVCQIFPLHLFLSIFPSFLPHCAQTISAFLFK